MLVTLPAVSCKQQVVEWLSPIFITLLVPQLGRQDLLLCWDK
jgi:hypothetical protein